MLSRFDWLRRSRTGAELLATLQYLAASPELPSAQEGLGPPHSAQQGPCLRCWVYARAPTAKRNARYCRTCQHILGKAWKLGDLSRHSVVVWGFTNHLPRQLRVESGFRQYHVVYSYVHDDNRFLLMFHRRALYPWLQDVALYHGADLKGFLQIFPTTGLREVAMGELLCRIVHNEARFPMDRLRVRFFADRDQVFIPHRLEREGVLTFDFADFLRTLEMASVFRSILQPDEQQALYRLLKMPQSGASQFYWGRLLGALSAQARDLLEAWKLRWWSEPHINLLYDLVQYVGFHQSH
jgi:hypothetical protein